MRLNVKIILSIPLIVVMVAITAAGTRAAAFELQIEGSRMSITAQRVPLRDVLYRLSDYGINVRIDPAINPVITAAFRNKPLEEGLKSILRPFNSIFLWRVADAETGSTAVNDLRLNEIQIFRPGQKEQMIQLDEEPDEAALQLPEEDRTRSQAFETPVMIKADRVFVPVVVSYGGRKLETRLIFDTGASSMVLHQDVADKLGIFDYTPAKGRGVGGIEIDARVAELESVQVGPYVKRDLRAAVVEYEGEPVEGYHGLLGMNFLRGLSYEIDFDRQVIKWGGDNAMPPAGGKGETADRPKE